MIDGRDPREEAEEGIASSGAVLAGGESRRFGRDKAHAMLGGKPLISHVVETLQTLFEDVLIIANRPLSYECFDVTVVSDVVGGAGCLGGLLTALIHAKAQRCFVVACDMPFLNAALVRRMLERCPGYDVVVPDLRGELQPLHAFYSKRCIGHIQEGFAGGEFRIPDLYPKVRTLCLQAHFWQEVDPENRSFVSVPTQEDLARARRWIERPERRDDDGQR